MNRLVLLVGNIGTGKSTIASKYAKRGYVIINNDDIVNMIHGGEYGLYNFEINHVYKSVTNAILKSAMKLNQNIVIDRTLMSKNDRKFYIDIAKKNNYTVKCIDFGPGNQESLNRRCQEKSNRGTTSKTWEIVHNKFYRIYEKPEYSEGFYLIQDAPIEFCFIAFDFDGTIVSNDFPKIGEINTKITDEMHSLFKHDDSIIIIWTCRSGEQLNEMRSFLIKNKIPFDYINENPIATFGSNKIFAHRYYDDRAVNVQI